MQWIAHRGCLRGPDVIEENTISAFQRCLTSNVNGIELDVHLTTDNEVIVVHDAVEHLDWAEISRNHPRIPRLQGVLELIKVRDNLIVYLELKTDANNNIYSNLVSKTLQLINTDKILIISFDQRYLQQVFEHRPQQVTGWLCDKLPTNEELRNLPDNCQYLGLNHSLIGQIADLRAIYGNRFKFNVWTVNLSSTVDECFNANVESITTDVFDTSIKKIR